MQLAAAVADDMLLADAAAETKSGVGAAVTTSCNSGLGPQTFEVPQLAAESAPGREGKAERKGASSELKPARTKAKSEAKSVLAAPSGLKSSAAMALSGMDRKSALSVSAPMTSSAATALGGLGAIAPKRRGNSVTRKRRERCARRTCRTRPSRQCGRGERPAHGLNCTEARTSISIRWFTTKRTRREICHQWPQCVFVISKCPPRSDAVRPTEEAIGQARGSRRGIRHLRASGHKVVMLGVSLNLESCASCPPPLVKTVDRSYICCCLT